MTDLYFDFLGSVWEQLPGEDRQRFILLWKSYEQVFAAAYQRYAEVNLNVALEDISTYATDRWLPFDFTEENRVVVKAEITSPQGISSGLNLSKRNQLKISVDGAAPLTVTLTGENPYKVSAEEIASSINRTFGYALASVSGGSVVKISSPTAGSAGSLEICETEDPEKNACEFVLGVEPRLLPFRTTGSSHAYLLPYPGIVSVPVLQDAAGEDYTTTVLREGEDFEIRKGGTISFTSGPPRRLWAKRTLVDREIPWKNFGFLVDIYQTNSPRYVEILRGLWYALWTGPKPSNVEASLSLLLGLPTAKDRATVTSVTASAIKTLSEAGVERTFQIPQGLSSKVAPGEVVEPFQPLTTGVKLFDKISSPGFLEKEFGRAGVQKFLTEEASLGEGPWTDETKALRTLEEYVFLPQITSEAFLNSGVSLSNVRTFLDAIRPLNKAYLFQVLAGPFSDNLSLGESLLKESDVDLSPTLDSNASTFLSGLILEDYEGLNYLDLNLDPHGILLVEKVEIEVKSSGVTVESFVI